MKDLDVIDMIIDTDIGDDVDDAFALCYAMKTPKVRILGVTTVFCDTVSRAKMAKKLLTLGGFGSIPVYAGEKYALQAKTEYGRPIDFDKKPVTYTSEYDDVKYDGDNAVKFIEETLEKSENKVVILTLGALTNVAKVLTERPDLKDKIAYLSVMGGAFKQNVGEYNFSCDPLAADIVMNCGLLTYVSNLELTFQCIPDCDHVEKLKQSTAPQIVMLCKLMGKWGYQVILHDPLAFQNAFDRSYCTFINYNVTIEHNAEYANGYVVNKTDWNWHQPVNPTLFVGETVKGREFANACINAIVGK